MTDLKKIEAKADELGRDLAVVASEIKRLQSAKCRLKKFKGRSDYEVKMTAILQEEEVLKEVRQLLDPKEKPVTMYTQDDVKVLDYDETVKALKSIQSKKCLTKYDPDNQEGYKRACEIESWLNEHKKSVKPVDTAYIRRTDLQTVIDTIKETGDIKVETIINMLENL